MEQFFLFWEEKNNPYACEAKYVTCFETAHI